MNLRQSTLLQRHPELAGKLPFRALMVEPTPVARLKTLENRVGADSLWVKRDDLTSPRYGGNKVRKLEWLLAGAVEAGAERVLTVGCVGSHHVLATAVFAQKLDLAVDAIQFPAPLSAAARRVIRATEAQGVSVIWAPNTAALIAQMGVQRAASGASEERAARYWIPGGGTGPLGTLGYVDAALELAEQIAAGELPEPACIFVATGTGGTQAGLVLGLKLAGLQTRVVGVRVVDRAVCNRRAIRKAANMALARLRKAGLEAAAGRVGGQDITLLQSAFGQGYGLPTEASTESVRLLADIEQLELEPVYTGKAMSGMLAEVLAWPELRKGPVLFWHTASSARLEPLSRSSQTTRHDLPPAYRAFIEESAAV